MKVKYVGINGTNLLAHDGTEFSHWELQIPERCHNEFELMTIRSA